jgi:translation initiation factor 1
LQATGRIRLGSAGTTAQFGEPQSGGSPVARIVYGTGVGDTRSREPGAREPQASAPLDAQPVRVGIERAGRGGKTVTVAAPLVLVRADAQALLGELKRACGSGGALTASASPDGAPAFALELQGDHVARAVALLRERGFRRAR